MRSSPSPTPNHEQLRFGVIAATGLRRPEWGEALAWPLPSPGRASSGQALGFWLKDGGPSAGSTHSADRSLVCTRSRSDCSGL